VRQLNKKCSVLLVLAAMALSTSCAHEPVAERPDASRLLAFTPTSTVDQHDELVRIEPNAGVYQDAPPALRFVASRFAVALLSYDTRSEHCDRFLLSLRPFVTRTLFRRLSVSPRARLAWWSMRARNERVTFVVSGATVRRRSPAPVVTILVNGIATTRTDVAVLRTPVALRLQMIRTANGWTVAGVSRSGA